MPDTFEQSLSHLETIVTQIDNRETGLDEAMALYKKGVALAKKCAKTLERHEKDVMQLAKEADGSFKLTPITDMWANHQ